MRSEDVRHDSQDSTDSASDTRRAATRMPFEGLVEVGGAVGPAFEAQAIDVSDEGMHLRTAYLPDLGQRLSCRFDAGPGGSVLASAEVIWRREEGRGGEFGLRFDEIDEESAQALRHLTGATNPNGGHGIGIDIDMGATGRDALPPQRIAHEPGSKVRLHIEGLGSPMRAKVKASKESAVAVASELGFLRVGKELDIEDATTGDKRAVRIDRVQVEVDDSSKIPNLIVTLKYTDLLDASVAASDGEKDCTPAPSATDSRATRPSVSLAGSTSSKSKSSSMSSSSTSSSAKSKSAVSAKSASDDDDLEAIKRASGGVKGAFARGAAEVMPAITKFAKRAQVTVALLAAKAKGDAKDETTAPVRRTTAPAPGGGLHTSGRKVVRGASEVSASEIDDGFAIPKSRIDIRKVGLGVAIGAAVLLVGVAMRKPSASTTASTAPAEGASATPAGPPALDPTTLAQAGTPGMIPPGLTAAPMAMPPATITPSSSFASNESPDDGTEGADGQGHKKHRLVVAPFTNGPVSHGNVLKLKMDGPIEKIQGASQPTGFTIVIPNRRSLEAAGPLAARDARIGSIRVTNDGNGAELSVAFKDGVPNYLVRAKGDVLEIALATMGALADDAHEKASASSHMPGKHADAKATGAKKHHVKAH